MGDGERMGMVSGDGRVSGWGGQSDSTVGLCVCRCPVPGEYPVQVAFPWTRPVLAGGDYQEFGACTRTTRPGVPHSGAGE